MNTKDKKLVGSDWMLGREMSLTSYWLIFKSDCERVEALTTRLPDGEEVLPVFSFREEAEMFLCLRGLTGSWQVRETGDEELRLMLCTVLGNVMHVALDPIPENSKLSMLELLSLNRQDFIEALERNQRCARLLQESNLQFVKRW